MELPATSDESTTATVTVGSSSAPPVPKRAWGDEDDDVGEHLESLTINLEEPVDSDISVTLSFSPSIVFEVGSRAMRGSLLCYSFNYFPFGVGDNR